MKTSAVVAGGIAGTFAVAIIHEGLKKVTSDAPRMELLDMEAISKILRSVDVEVPEKENLLKLTLVAEIVSHTLYYGFVGSGNKKDVWNRGVLLGLAAGITAIVLPKPLGLQGAPGKKKPQTQIMTVALYLLGGLVASAAGKWVNTK